MKNLVFYPPIMSHPLRLNKKYYFQGKPRKQPEKPENDKFAYLSIHY